MEPAIQHVTIEYLTQGINSEEKEQAIKEGLVLRGYLSGDFSTGKVAEILGLNYRETQNWLRGKGIPVGYKENEELLLEAAACFHEKMKDPLFKAAWENDDPRDEIEKEPDQTMKARLIIHAWIEGKLSMGEVAELLGVRYIEARQWFHDQGITTMRELPPELKTATDQNRQDFIERLRIKLNK
ncbi:MAG: UPF0175 family protein [Deltaproteobacteria bacterium]|nr:UPF0175 family protein [Deltaproteobacteria bacterium]